ncbi:hypothetical protein PanWU01x14_002200 [Parasponia andersonii]|uniref:Uncharacterized protein n=1 Tax=Parasponia andersonii TaxID=3476 RepID=A0A2P5E542_PARAD|nr:hypothetical protein PanWU01x14_002200 [Parasponia andersonii]
MAPQHHRDTSRCQIGLKKRPRTGEFLALQCYLCRISEALVSILITIWARSGAAMPLPRNFSY